MSVDSRATTGWPSPRASATSGARTRRSGWSMTPRVRPNAVGPVVALRRSRSDPSCPGAGRGVEPGPRAGTRARARAQESVLRAGCRAQPPARCSSRRDQARSFQSRGRTAPGGPTQGGEPLRGARRHRRGVVPRAAACRAGGHPPRGGVGPRHAIVPRDWKHLDPHPPGRGRGTGRAWNAHLAGGFGAARQSGARPARAAADGSAGRRQDLGPAAGQGGRATTDAKRK